MLFNKSFPYSTSITNNVKIAAILSFAVVFILIFLQPFGANNFYDPYKGLYFIGYGIISFIVYLSLYFLSRYYYSNFKRWRLVEELEYSLLYISAAIIIVFILSYELGIDQII